MDLAPRTGRRGCPRKKRPWFRSPSLSPSSGACWATGTIVARGTTGCSSRSAWWGGALVYAFAYLVPLGMMRLWHVPARFRYTCLLTLFAAFMLSAYAGIGWSNLTRPLFNVIGPLLSIASAILLRDSSACNGPCRLQPSCILQSDDRVEQRTGDARQDGHQYTTVLLAAHRFQRQAGSRRRLQPRPVFPVCQAPGGKRGRRHRP